MVEPISRGSPWEVGLVGVFLVSSGFSWWGIAHASGSLFDLWPIVGILFAAICFGVLVALDEANTTLRHIAVLGGFGSAVVIAFLPSLLLGVCAAVVAVILAEVGAVRAKHFREAFRKPQLSLLVPRGLAAYLTAVSLMVTAIISISPLGQSFFNPLPEPLLRRVISLIDPFAEPRLGFSLTDSVDTILVKRMGPQSPAVLEQLRAQYSQMAGTPLKGDEDIASLLSVATARQVAALQQEFGFVYRIGMFLSVFFLIRFLAAPLSFIAFLSVLLAVSLLKNIGAIIVVEEPSVRVVLRWQ